MVMLRYNQGKAPLSLVPTSFFRSLMTPQGFVDMDTLLIEDVAHVLGFGAQKYAPNNWRKSGSWLAVADCGMRHLMKITRGETHDIESGIHHAAHAGCNIAFLLEFIDQRSGEDDRYETEKQPFIVPRTPNLHFDLTMQFLLQWKDGGHHAYLDNAARSLAMYYEDLDASTRAFIPGTSPFAPIKVTIN